jgi:hypothetical protein
VVTNIFSARLYAKNEVKDKKIVEKPQDFIDMKFEDMDERDFDRVQLPERSINSPHKIPDVGHMDLNYDPDEVYKM